MLSPKQAAPTQSQLSRPMSSGHHISMEHRLRRKQLNSDTNASKKNICKKYKKKEKKKPFSSEKMKKENEKTLKNQKMKKRTKNEKKMKKSKKKQKNGRKKKVGKKEKRAQRGTTPRWPQN